MFYSTRYYDSLGKWKWNRSSSPFFLKMCIILCMHWIYFKFIKIFGVLLVWLIGFHFHILPFYWILNYRIQGYNVWFSKGIFSKDFFSPFALMLCCIVEFSFWILVGWIWIQSNFYRKVSTFISDYFFSFQLWNSNFIYEIPCIDCELTYIGQTKQRLKIRINRTNVIAKLFSIHLGDHIITAIGTRPYLRFW